VANVPALLLHEIVMPLTNEPIHLPQTGSHDRRGQKIPYFPARNARLTVDQQLFEKDASLGVGARHPSLTSRRYREAALGKVRYCRLPMLPWC
jgi:hypothetical protein